MTIKSNWRRSNRQEGNQRCYGMKGVSGIFTFLGIGNRSSAAMLAPLGSMVGIVPFAMAVPDMNGPERLGCRGGILPGADSPDKKPGQEKNRNGNAMSHIEAPDHGLHSIRSIGICQKRSLGGLIQRSQRAISENRVREGLQAYRLLLDSIRRYECSPDPLCDKSLPSAAPDRRSSIRGRHVVRRVYV